MLRRSAGWSPTPIFPHSWISRRGFGENSNYRLKQKNFQGFKYNLLLGSIYDNYSSENSENRVIVGLFYIWTIADKDMASGSHETTGGQLGDKW